MRRGGSKKESLSLGVYQRSWGWGLFMWQDGVVLCSHVASKIMLAHQRRGPMGILYNANFSGLSNSGASPKALADYNTQQ